MEEQPSSQAEESFLGELRLSRQLRGRAQAAAVGLIIALGFALVVPGPLLAEAGTASLMPVLIALIALALTFLSTMELLGGSGERGGTFAIAHETLGGPFGFLAAWMLLAGFAVLGGIFLQSVGCSLLTALPALAGFAPLVAPGFFAILLLLNLFSLLPRREVLSKALVLLAGLLVAGWLAARGSAPAPPVSSQQATPQIPRAAAWIMILFAGAEALLSARRRIQDPLRLLPQGLALVLLIGGLVVLVSQAAMMHLPGAELSASPAFILRPGRGQPAWAHLLLLAAGNLTLVVGAHGAYIAAARQIYALVQAGALPRRLGRISRPFRLPPLIFALLTLLSVPPLLWPSGPWTLDLAAGLFIGPSLILNLTALRSRYAEPERRRLIVLPFHPLIPSLGLAMSTALLLSLPRAGWLGLLLWTLAGILLFLGYARTRLLEAQHGVLIFGKEPTPEKAKGAYRVLVPLSAGIERRLTLRLAAAIAKQMHGEVVPLQVIPIADPLAMQEGRRLAQERNTLFQWSTREPALKGIPTYPITRLASSVPKAIQDTAVEEDCDLILMSWAVDSPHEGSRMGRVLDPVVRNAPCDVAVVAYHPEAISTRNRQAEGAERQIRRILVPTAGGPHAPLATRLALLLAREFDASIQTVYIASPDAGEKELAAGHERIAGTLKSMQEQWATLPFAADEPADVYGLPIEMSVVPASSVVEGIVEAGEACDLLFLGASEESLLDQMLFGTLPDQVARQSETPVVMVRSYRGLPRFWLQRLWDGISGAFPTLSLSEQVDVYKEVRRGARPDRDFFIMMGLSSIIATFGLLQGSTAVIIGAMLVAPLFTPILALSLAIVQGDIRLLRLAVESALKGITLAIGVAAVLGALSPLRSLTHEILIRTSPNLFDLAVALASGAAGAYAVARKDVATALPGVAIAAALVPPLGVIGIGMALLDGSVVSGGFLLFTTNLIAIMLAGAVTLLLLGFRPTGGHEREARLRLGILTSIVLLIVITIPLALVFIDAVQTSRSRQIIDQVLTDFAQADAAIQLVDYEFTPGPQHILDLEITLNAARPIEQADAEALEAAFQHALGGPVRLRLIRVPVETLEWP